ncbi:hypothetical protein MNBD_GAMMA22-2963 [hydrothermal vent metagenome]|uniref:Uncharacterized protein n=1 Tax=hydrothermal vent metagenome TaxID=652676 RepID=A0A3B1B608_9ZZZZ
MKKYLFMTLVVCASLNHPAFAAKPNLSETNMSKSELCDFAIQALQELLKQSPDGKNKPAITKEQCMAISDDDINKAAQKLMESESKK